jgi:ABC-type transport system involved in cytochrome c biogenesis permease subunit
MLASIFAASVWTGLAAAATAAIASVLFLRTRDFFYDSLALAVTEIGLVLLAAGIVAGAAAGHMAGGLWWMWNAHLTAALVAVLLYAPYLMLRRAVEEPTRRAASAAVVSILAIFNVPMIMISVDWWLAKRVATPPVALDWMIAPLALIGTVLAWLRLRKEQDRRAQDAARRTAQEL